MPYTQMNMLALSDSLHYNITNTTHSTTYDVLNARTHAFTHAYSNRHTRVYACTRLKATMKFFSTMYFA